MAKKKTKLDMKAKNKQNKKGKKNDVPQRVATEKELPPPPAPELDVKQLGNNMPRYFSGTKAASVDLGWYCNPRSIVFTQQNQLWISDPPRYRILRYKFNDDKIYERLEDLHTNCKVYFLKTIDKSLVMGIARRKDQDGFIKFQLPGPKIEKIWRELNPADQLNATDPEVEKKKKGEKGVVRGTPKITKLSRSGKEKVDVEMRIRFEIYEPSNYFIREDQLLDFAFEDEILYVIYHPDFKLETYLMRRMFQMRSKFQSSTERRIELRTSGGIVVFKEHMYLLANNPARVIIFTVKRELVSDTVTFTHKTTVGQFHLTSPFGLTCDWLGNLLVSDQSDRCIYVFNRAGLMVGRVNTEALQGQTTPGYMSISHNGTLAFIDNGNNRSLVVIPLDIIHIYDRKKFLVKRYTKPQFSFLTYQR